MRTTSRFDKSRTVEFLAGPWCGMKYTPQVGRQYPVVFHVPTSNELHVYDCRRVDGKVMYVHAGRLLPDGALIR